MKINCSQGCTLSSYHRRWLFFLWAAVFFVTSGGPLYAQVFYGTTRAGGTSGGGTIFKTYNDGSGFATEYNFQIDANPGKWPDYCQMVLANGKLYGVTPFGGKYDGGVLYQFDPATNKYVVLVDFYLDVNMGINPYGSLVLAAGKLYGMTLAGGIHYSGTLFEYDLTGNKFTKKIDFDGANKGAAPLGGLTLFTNSKLYGMTSQGGTNNKGVIFEFNPSDGSFNKKFDFDGPNFGSTPFRDLTVSGSKLYGMTFSGGTGNLGVLFEFDPAATSNAVVNKINFDGTVHGSAPVGNLLLASNGKLYGATHSGGAKGTGILFEYTIGVSLINKVDFADAMDLNGNGAYPGPALVQHANGKIYGFCEGGGFSGAGTLWEFDPTVGATTPFVKRFDFGGLSGYAPKSGMTLANGKLYGAAAGGGQTESGVIFSFEPTLIAPSDLNKVLDFNLAGNGSYPENSMVQAPNGKLYGMTPDGGPTGWGVLFEYDPTTKVYTKKIDFDNSGTKGANPQGNLALASNGLLYGMTLTGGSVNQGIIFEYNPATNILTKKVDFDYAFNIGVNPRGGLTFVPSKARFYGMTATAGVGFNGFGTLFEYIPGSTSVTKRVDFDGAVLTKKGS